MAPAIFHTSMNTAGAFLPVTLMFLPPLLLLILFIVAHERMWRRLSEDHPAVLKAVGPNADTTRTISS